MAATAAAPSPVTARPCRAVSLVCRAVPGALTAFRFLGRDLTRPLTRFRGGLGRWPVAAGCGA
ncbi:hypothetical protein, partial [Acidiferrobacter thiooxydans]